MLYEVITGRLDKNIMKICGSKSGHNLDKFSELNITAEEAEHVSVPAIKEVPLTLECKVIYRQTQDPDAIGEKIKIAYYPQDVDSSFCGSNKDYHVMYTGEIRNNFV